jgi:branched-subunit amino acid transport protein AzlD
LTIEMGVMAMLVVAGLIEGFVSPSSIGFPARIAVLVASLTVWIGYIVLSGRQVPGRSASGAEVQPRA